MARDGKPARSTEGLESAVCVLTVQVFCHPPGLADERVWTLTLARLQARIRGRKQAALGFGIWTLG